MGCGVSDLSVAVRLIEAALGARVLAAELSPATSSVVTAALRYPYKAYLEYRVLS